MTSQRQIYNAKAIAIDLEKAINQAIKAKVHIDDWSDYGSFRAFIFLDVSRFSDLCLRKVGKIIRRELDFTRYGCVIERLTMPKRTYVRNHYKKYFNGYDGTTITLDFKVY